MQGSQYTDSLINPLLDCDCGDIQAQGTSSRLIFDPANAHVCEGHVLISEERVNLRTPFQLIQVKRLGGGRNVLLQVFVDHGLLTPEELEEVLVSEFNPVRMGFRGITEITTRDVLNCGVSPERLLDIVKQRFLEAGGCVKLPT